MDKENVEAIARCSRTFASCAASVGQVGSHLARLAAALNVAVARDDFWSACGAVDEVNSLLHFALEVDYDLLVESADGLNESLRDFYVAVLTCEMTDSLEED